MTCTSQRTYVGFLVDKYAVYMHLLPAFPSRRLIAASATGGSNHRYPSLEGGAVLGSRNIPRPGFRTSDNSNGAVFGTITNMQCGVVMGLPSSKSSESTVCPRMRAAGFHGGRGYSSAYSEAAEHVSGFP